MLSIRKRKKKSEGTKHSKQSNDLVQITAKIYKRTG